MKNSIGLIMPLNGNNHPNLSEDWLIVTSSKLLKSLSSSSLNKLNDDIFSVCIKDEYKDIPWWNHFMKNEGQAGTMTNSKRYIAC